MSTERATEFAQTATLTGAPGTVADQVHVRTLDTLAAATAGSRTSTVDVTRDYVRKSLDDSAVERVRSAFSDRTARIGRVTS